MADDDPHYFVLSTNPLLEKLSTIPVSENLFRKVLDSGRIRSVDIMGNGSDWWELVP